MKKVNIKTDDAKIINILADNKKVLVMSILDKLSLSSLEMLHRRDHKFTLLHITRDDCGCEFSYKTELDIPNESVICEHGNEVIKYTN
jgi:hypothetical protein